MQQGAGAQGFDFHVATAEQPGDARRIDLHAHDVFVGDGVFGVDGDGQRLDGLAVRVFHHRHALAHAVLVLMVAEIDRQQHRRADHCGHQRVMLKSDIHDTARGADRQEERRGAEEIFQVIEDRQAVAQRDQR